MKLIRPDVYRGKDKAVKHVILLAKALDIQVPRNEDFDKDLILDNKAKTLRLNFRQEINCVRKTGKADMLQSWFDARDRFLQPAMELHVHGDVPGLEFTLESSIGSHTSYVSNYGILESPEIALASDICFYHKEACDLYNSHDLRGFSRCFRGYLFSCVSLIDCFLFKYAFHVRDLIGDTSQYVNTLTLDSKSRTEERLEAWMTTFAFNEVEKFKNWSERSQFIELKKKRNEFAHPTAPVVSFEPRDIVRFLNYGATGVGRLLGKMRRASRATDRIGFIHQISSLPKVSISKNG